MFMQKSGRNFTAKLSLNALFDDVGLALWPSHYQNFFGLANSVNSHGDGAFGNVLEPTETVSCIFSGDSVQVDQSSDAVDRRGRLVEPDVTGAADAQYLNIYSSIRFYLFLVIRTKLDDIFPADLSAGNVDIFSGDVDVIEEMVIHIVVIWLWIVVLDGKVLIQVEGYHIFEAQFSVFVQADQLPVDSDGSASCGQAQNESFSSDVLLCYGLFYQSGHSDRGLPWSREEVGWDLFYEWESGEFGKVVGGFSDWDSFVKL